MSATSNGLRSGHDVTECHAYKPNHELPAFPTRAEEPQNSMARKTFPPMIPLKSQKEPPQDFGSKSPKKKVSRISFP
jgi:hypothetical protein